MAIIFMYVFANHVKGLLLISLISQGHFAYATFPLWVNILLKKKVLILLASR